MDAEDAHITQEQGTSIAQNKSQCATPPPVPNHCNGFGTVNQRLVIYVGYLLLSLLRTSAAISVEVVPQ